MGKRIPKHVVILADGNRHWAKQRGLHPWKGHEAGAKRFFQILDSLYESSIEMITIWGWSTENWKRDPKEIKMIMKIFVKYLKLAERKMTKYKIRLRHLGRKERLPKEVTDKISHLEQISGKFSSSKYLNLALDYGGRNEILRAIKKIAEDRIDFEKLDEGMFSSYLDTAGLPDPDLIIRTSGEQRLSGIMPWQGVYAELYFAEVDFPDFDTKEFNKAIEWYGQRERRFGGDSKM